MPLNPAKFLALAHSLIVAGRVVVTSKARFEAEDLGLTEEDVVLFVLELDAGDFLHTRPGRQGGTLYVFAVEDLYIKLRTDDRGCVVISFHEEYA